ncbi:MAG: DUF1684 domain-containing protein [Chitinophagaceae bacterium]|nr:MAG: DUF1684 domain-containing protein [Chitinophagaceae bacterium]
MKKLRCLFVFIIGGLTMQAQPANYVEKLRAYQQEYVQQHEVVSKEDKKYFRFFPVAEKYRVKANFMKLADTVGFLMKTSGAKTTRFFRYGKLTFTLRDSSIQLTLYQSEQLMLDTTYQDYLFLPFTDGTSGEESYGGGRYLDLRLGDIKDNIVRIDFNKAYNPYCAYSSGYNCPIPPGENYIPLAIKAGEQNFTKPSH